MNGMKFPRLRSLIRVGLCTAACLILVACNKTDASKKLSPEAALPTRLDWNLKTLVEPTKRPVTPTQNGMSQPNVP